ncbi:MAG TPA: hypothetical protein VG841_16330 [Caulobacterales bacterium]|nr:hypothetical protein [Caulobacterales bacterium]
MTHVRFLFAACALALAPMALTSPSAAAAELIVVHRAPPPLRHEIVVARPGPAHLWYWQPGFWRWRHDDFDWVPGHWVRRPNPRAVWVAPHWTHRRGEWVFVEGHWR